MERDAFLHRIRSSIGEATLPDGPAVDPGPLVPDLPDVDLIQRFTKAVEAVSGKVHTGPERFTPTGSQRRSTRSLHPTGPDDSSPGMRDNSP